jgi:hypothetical protein
MHKKGECGGGGVVGYGRRVMVLNATFGNISVQSNYRTIKNYIRVTLTVKRNKHHLV